MGDAENQYPIAKGKIDEKADHLPCSVTAEENSRALATT